MTAAKLHLKVVTPTRVVVEADVDEVTLPGALGALVYTLHCPELEAPFLGVWYVLGMLIPAVLGAIVGPRVLRW